MLFPRHLKQHLAVFLCESGIRVLGERREHSLVVHVVSEYHRVVRFEPLSLTACIKVRATVDVVLPVNVVMQVVLWVVGMRLHDGRVDVGPRHGNPTDNVRVHRSPIVPVDLVKCGRVMYLLQFRLFA